MMSFVSRVQLGFTPNPWVDNGIKCQYFAIFTSTPLSTTQTTEILTASVFNSFGDLEHQVCKKICRLSHQEYFQLRSLSQHNAQQSIIHVPLEHRKACHDMLLNKTASLQQMKLLAYCAKRASNGCHNHSKSKKLFSLFLYHTGQACHDSSVVHQ